MIANKLCVKLESLIDHKRQQDLIDMSDLERDQHQKFTDYKNQLDKDIKKLEKEIAEL